MSLEARHRCLFHHCLHCSACLRWGKQLLGAAPGRDGSPPQREPCQPLQDDPQPGARGEPDRNAAGYLGSGMSHRDAVGTPKHRLLSLTALAHPVSPLHPSTDITLAP